MSKENLVEQWLSRDSRNNGSTWKGMGMRTKVMLSIGAIFVVIITFSLIYNYIIYNTLMEINEHVNCNDRYSRC